MPVTREFTRPELAALGVPPDSPEDVEYSDILLADEHVTVLKYTQLRRCIFETDGRAWAVEYEAALEAGDYDFEPPDDYGWYGTTVTATAMQERQVTVTRWVPQEES